MPKKTTLQDAARAMGKVGGKARAVALSPERRAEIAATAGKAGAAARQASLTPEERSALARKAGKAGGRGRGKKKDVAPAVVQPDRSK